METVITWAATVVAVLAGVVAAAKAIVSMTPSKRDDEIVAKLEAAIKKVEELTRDRNR